MAPPAADAANVVPAAAEVDPARRAAAVALARQPDDDPWAYAQRVAASSPAEAKSGCGLPGSPLAGTPSRVNAQEDSDAERPASPAYLAETRRIDHALRRSADPFDRAVADALNVGGVLAPEARLDALIEQALNSNDPRLYALAYANCFAGAPPDGACRQLSARRWAELDPGNAQPWLDVFSDSVRTGDVSGQQEALSHMASSARFDSRYLLAAGAVAARRPEDDSELAADYALTVQATQAAGNLPDFTALMQACRAGAGGDVNRAQQCQAVSDVMFDHSDTILARMMGGQLYFQATGDPSRRDVARAERAVFSAHWSPATGFSECDVVRDGLRSAARGARLGELEAARERSRVFVTP